jgi:hypothetical protein
VAGVGLVGGELVTPVVVVWRGHEGAAAALSLAGLRLLLTRVGDAAGLAGWGGAVVHGGTVLCRRHLCLPAPRVGVLERWRRLTLHVG